MLEEAELAVLTNASSEAKLRLQTLANAFGEFDVAFCNFDSHAFTNRMLAVSAFATATSVSTPLGRRQSAGTLASILQYPIWLNGAAQAVGSAQLAALAQDAVANGDSDQVTADIS
jgi:hypothetical protein